MQLPFQLGKIVDVLSHIAVGNGDGSFLLQLRDPAFKLFGIYVAQVRHI